MTKQCCSGVCRDSQDEIIGSEFVAARQTYPPAWFSFFGTGERRDGFDLRSKLELLSQFFR
jgi:hypothetical protein